MKRVFKLFLPTLILLSLLARLSGQSALSDADIAIAGKDYKEALRICTQLINQGEQNPAIDLRLGIIYSSLLDYPKALEHLIAAEAGGEKNLSSGLLIAGCYESIGAIDSASAKYEEIIYADRSNIFPVISFSKMLITYRMFGDALPWCQLLVDSVPDNAVFRKNLGGCFLQLAMDPEALKHLGESWRLNNMDISLLPAMTTAWLRARIPESGLPVMREAVMVHPASAVVHKSSANLYFAMERYDSAAIAYQAAFNLGDTSLFITRQLGLCYYAGKKFSEAVPFLLKSYESDTLDFEAAQYLALSLSNSGRQKEAITYFNFAIQMLLPDSSLLSGLYAETGRAAYDINSYDIALKSYNDALKYNPNEIDLVFELARLYDTKKEYQSAFSYYERYLRHQDKIIKEIAESRNLDPSKINLGGRYEFAKDRIEKIREELFFQGEIKRINL